ncbi:DNA repair protein RecN [Geomicrobium sediminis]|uniref:DNA repair protein RecN n=1 Tax=Geomicrobium sediminis TaxID=1347788 RepID=A0ABS2PEZ8_9BACL|nr:DNA repair protein RecN [Geomicrobium sediminis]MBM7633640.1 DNA repair protein RecN (Recombination protein N) [Geomicrobium sediminis]
MIEELTIRNFAIIDELSLSFSTGLTVLTGETGAGKSIIIDALGLLAGGRSSVDFVRYGSQKAEIEGLFRVTKYHPVIDILDEAGISIEDEMVIIKREINDKGKSTCRVNGQLVTLTMQRAVGQTLIDIHGQHEHQELLQMDKHSHMIDTYAGGDLQATKDLYQQSFRELQEIQADLKRLRDNDRENVQRLDLIQYQLEEIQNANVNGSEDEELERERFKLANMEKLFSQLQQAFESLYGESSGLESIREAMISLNEAAAIDKELSELDESLSSNFYLLEEVTFALRDHLEQLDFDPERLNEITIRLDELNQLKRKYGSTLQDVIEYAKNIEDESQELMHLDERISQYETRLKEVGIQAVHLVKELSTKRKNAATQLSSAIEKELQDLYMEKTTFSVQCKNHSRGLTVQTDDQEVVLSEDGAERLEFYLSPNPGEPEKSLAKVASGGEISRIMLALKRILTNQSERTSLIFDEVDTGVSGRVAQAIGEKIYAISSQSQVLCITHLPQVAALATTHLYIQKQEDEGRVSTSVTELNNRSRVNEIARMLSGAEVTKKTKESAEELLQFARTHSVS